MTDPRLEKARQLMKEEADRKNGTNRGSSFGDNASYPFWRISPGAVATIRLLPDKDENNAWPWKERQVIKLPFAGTVGGEYNTDQQVQVTVPCIDMFGDTCPIIAYTKPWWKDDAKKDMARIYWKKKSNIGQGFVVSSPFTEETVPENPIRRFTFGNELVEKLKAGMADTDMEYWPTDYLNGYDFRIRKTVRGEFNSYTTSDWSRKSRPLSEAEQLAIQQHGLFNLADYLGARPDADGVAAIRAMFHASVAGEPYDFTQFGKYYRPYVANASANSHDDDELPPARTAPPRTTVDMASKPAVADTVAVDADADANADVSANTVAPEVAAKALGKGGKASTQDLMAQLRDRVANRG